MSPLDRPVLVGDNIENPSNALALRDAAALYDWKVAFRDHQGLASAIAEAASEWTPRWADLEAVASAEGPLIALDNAENAASVYGFRIARPERIALVVGNERRGIAPDFRRAASHRLEIPMVSRRVDTLNVAAASAVALHYLARGGGGRQFVRSDPEACRPEVLFLAPLDHVELGSALRSAAAFGFRRAFVADRHQVWFGAGRARITEGRAAARRAKNTIRIVPFRSGEECAFDEAVVVTLGNGDVPIARAHLARGVRQVVVIADEGSSDGAEEALGRLAHRIVRAGLGVPVLPEPGGYRYRLPASIALAEVARQVGIRAPRAVRGRRPPVYDRRLRLLESAEGETWSLDELMVY